MLLIEATTLSHALMHELEQFENVPFGEYLGAVCQHYLNVCPPINNIVQTLLNQLV